MLNENIYKMDQIISILRERIADYKMQNNLNTNTIRGQKIHGVAHDTIWKLTTKDDFIPSFGIIKKLLNGFEIPFVESHSIRLIENEV